MILVESGCTAENSGRVDAKHFLLKTLFVNLTVMENILMVLFFSSWYLFLCDILVLTLCLS